MIKHSILGWLVCPVTKQNLVPLAKAKEKLIYSALSKGKLFTIDGQAVDASANDMQFLCTDNHRHIYCIVKGTPILLESKQIDFELDNV